MMCSIKVETMLILIASLLLFHTEKSGVKAFSGVKTLPSAFKSAVGSSTRTSTLLFATASSQQELHPAVASWPEKYTGSIIAPDDDGCIRGPRILHSKFTVEKATTDLKEELDVQNWPTWTTANNPKWEVNKQNVDKVMPYGELSYVLSGKLEIIPNTADVEKDEVYIVQKGDFVTFPEGFTASWRVLEELTWHYYLY